MDTLRELLTDLGLDVRDPALWTWVRSMVLLLVGLPLSWWLARRVRVHVTRRWTPQAGMVAGKFLFYSLVVLLLVVVLRQLGFALTPLLGAAGVVGIALGFAGQTSLSNIISGVFLIIERPFQVDDLIQVGDVTGRVLSIDFLSVKVRTFDNRYVRLPNETLIKSNVTNITRFPIRRVNLDVGVHYREDLERVREVLIDVAHRNPLALEEPQPMVMPQGFGDSSVNLLLVAWALRDDWIFLKNQLIEQIHARFREEGIEIPFPQRVFTMSPDSGPVRVRETVGEDGPPPPPGDDGDMP